MKNKFIEDQINEAANKILEDLYNMPDEELIKELEECGYGPFSQMLEDRFELEISIEQERHDRSISN